LNRRHGLAALLGLAGAAWRPARAAPAPESPLRLALAPFLSPAALLTAYRPLREHLERALQRPVEVATAKDFRTLVEAARRGDHDVVQLPAHLARLALVDWGFDFVAVPTERVSVVVVVKGGGPVRAAADLKGRSMGMLDPLSLTATVGRRWLQDQGLTGEVTVQALPSVNSGLFALDRGDVAAFVAADTQLMMLPGSTPRGEVVLATVVDIPGPIFIARPGLPAAELAALRSAMYSFAPDPALPATTANSAFRGIDQPRLLRLDPLAAIARQALAAPR
jgi:phosphonate transport system substrate-binding protein